MNVIIRLQNLPWSASALDIRQYFHGLAIPDGGVHIVGGELGDAFIAFSTDEDARQAMLMDGGKIKDVTVRLHLSSRSQMQKVIEDARQGAMQPFLQIPASVPQTLNSVQSTANLMNNVAQMSHMGGQMTSQMTSQMTLTAGQMLQVLPGQLTQSSLSHGMLGAGQVAAPGRGGMPGVTSAAMGAASMGDAGVQSAAPLGAARFPFGGMVMGGPMMGGTLGVPAGTGAALPMPGSGGVRAPARDSPAIEEDADDRKDDDVGRRRDRRDRSRSRERRDRDRYRDRDRSGYDRRRRSRERSRDRGRRRRSRSSSRSRDRNQRRSSRDKRDHDRSNEGPALEGNAASTPSVGLLKTPERPQEGPWNQQPNQVGSNLRGLRDDGPASGIGASGAGIMGGAPIRMGMSGPGVSLDLGGLRAPGGMPGNSLRGPVPNQGVLPMRNGPGGFGGGMGPGNMDGARRPTGPWMPRDNLPPDVDRRQDVLDDRRGFGGPGPNGPGRARMNTPFNRPGPEGDTMNRVGMSMPGPNFMDRGGSFNRPGMGMPDHPLDRFRPNGFDRNTPMNRPISGLMDRMRPNPVATPGANKFSEMDNGDEDYEEQDMDMEDPFPDTEESCEEERSNQPPVPVMGNSRNPPLNPAFSGGRPEQARDDRYPFRDDRYDRSRRPDRDRDQDRDYDRDRDRDRGRDRDRRDRDRYRPRSNERERDRKDSRYDRHGKDEFGRDKPDDRYSKERYKERPPEPNTCIEIRDMATHTGYGDIRRFFQPIVIPGPGLKIINDDTGRRTGVAYIRFNSRRDRETALTYSKATLKGESVLISDLSDEIFENAVDSYLPHDRDVMMDERQHEKLDLQVKEEPQQAQSNSQVESGNQYTCVVVHNAPSYAQDDDIRRLFKYCSLDVFLEVSKEGRRQKLAYVKFKKTEDCTRFLFANSKFQIGNIEVKVVGCSEKEYEDAKLRVTGALVKPELAENKPAESNPIEIKPKDTANPPEAKSMEQNAPIETKPDQSPDVICVPDDENEDSQNMSGRAHEDMMIQPSPQRPLKALNTDCVCLRNLPPHAIDRDILDFFTDVGLVPLKIHIMVDYMRNPIGEAFCEFHDGHETARAATKHHSHMGKFVVNVIPVSRIEMNNALNITSEPISEANRGGPLIGAAPLMGGSPMMMGGGPGPGGPGPGGPGPGGPGSGGPPRPGFHGPPGHFNHGGHPGYMGPRGLGGPNGPGPLMRGAPNNHALLGAGPAMGHPGGPQGRMQLQDITAESFGRPGCVVACENIPFRAEIDDILEFFRDFNLTPDSVIRRFNERGLATGDARIAFNSPAEAQSAMRDLRFQKLQGRTIYMRLM